jgi:nitrogenase-associated protein
MPISLIFYEKPGCISNTRQKAMLQTRGHQVIARNLLTESWTAERLRLFFGERPLTDWFNPAAPRLKRGEVKPDELDEATALALMVADPLLIRRPLIECELGVGCGFEPSPLLDALDIAFAPKQDMQSCPKTGSKPRCEITADAVGH